MNEKRGPNGGRVCPKCNSEEGCHGGCNCGHLKAWTPKAEDDHVISEGVRDVPDGDAERFMEQAARAIAKKLAQGIPMDLAHAITVCEMALNLVDALDYGEGPIRSRLLDACQAAKKEIDDQWEDCDDGD